MRKLITGARRTVLENCNKVDDKLYKDFCDIRNKKISELCMGNTMSRLDGEKKLSKAVTGIEYIGASDLYNMRLDVWKVVCEDNNISKRICMNTFEKYNGAVSEDLGECINLGMFMDCEKPDYTKHYPLPNSIKQQRRVSQLLKSDFNIG